MAEPKCICSGTEVKLRFHTIDNALTVYVNPDNHELAGWVKVFEFSNGAVGTPHPRAEVDISDVLRTFKDRIGKSKCKVEFKSKDESEAKDEPEAKDESKSNCDSESVILTFIGTNFRGPGQIHFTIIFPEGEEEVKVNQKTWTSRQWAYKLHLSDCPKDKEHPCSCECCKTPRPLSIT